MVDLLGFGQDGPLREAAGSNDCAGDGWVIPSPAARAGRCAVGIPVADSAPGSSRDGVLTALLDARFGQGQWGQSSLFAGAGLMWYFRRALLMAARFRSRPEQSTDPRSDGVFRTADGHINIAASGNAIWVRCAEALGHPEWAEEERFASARARSDNRDALNALIEAVTVTDTSAAWVAKLNKAGVPSGPINSIDQVFADEQVKHLGIAQTLGEVAYVGQPFALSRTPSSIVSHPPEAGEHTDKILASLGLDAAAIADLRARKVV